MTDSLHNKTIVEHKLNTHALSQKGKNICTDLIHPEGIGPSTPVLCGTQPFMCVQCIMHRHILSDDEKRVFEGSGYDTRKRNLVDNTGSGFCLDPCIFTKQFEKSSSCEIVGGGLGDDEIWYIQIDAANRDAQELARHFEETKLMFKKPVAETAVNEKG